jgi:phospholipid N-methyltransferase
LADRSRPSADLIISTLPWVAFTPSATQRPLLATLVESLASGGAYTQAAYAWTRWAPPARRQLRQLQASSEEVVAGAPLAGEYAVAQPLRSHDV